MPDPRSALEMGRRSAAMGDTEDGPGYFDQLVGRLRDMATIRPSPTGSRLENASELAPYFLPMADAAGPLVRSLMSRLRGAPQAMQELAPEVSSVNPAVKMPAVVKVESPPMGPPAAPGFHLGDMPPMVGDLPDLSNVPISKTKVPAKSLANLQSRTGQ